jgi:hypothetical protein
VVVNLVGEEAKCFRWDQFAPPQGAAGVAQRAKLQGEAQPIAIMPTPVNRLEISPSLGPVRDQDVLLGRQGEQLIELCSREHTASRHGQIVPKMIQERIRSDIAAVKTRNKRRGRRPGQRPNQTV